MHSHAYGYMIFLDISYPFILPDLITYSNLLIYQGYNFSSGVWQWALIRTEWEDWCLPDAIIWRCCLCHNTDGALKYNKKA